MSGADGGVGIGASGPQIVFDVSTLARSRGQAVGIVRVVRELARWARANRSDVLFVIFDRERGLFREVAQARIDAILDGSDLVDISSQPSKRLAVARGGPSRVARLRRWVRNPRRRAIVALERLRLTGVTGEATTERLMSLLLTPKLRAEFTDNDGLRRTLLPFDMAVGAPAVLNSGQLLVCPGSDWPVDVIEHVRERKSELGFRLAFVCYDPIPLLYPQFFWAPTAEGFHQLFHRIVPLADVVIVTARQVADDIAGYCGAHGLPVPVTQAFRPGSDLPRSAAGGRLPAGLVPGHYACFVSTIEPRKGHRLLLSVWRRLEAAGIPQAAGFKLVFIGRRGWLVDELMRDLETAPSFGKSLLVLSGVSDADLATVYRNAAFGLYPSLYEGYGLPVVEMFQYGKAVLASSGGALEEVVGAFSPCLDPRDENAWFEAIRAWILDPAARAPYEAVLSDRFSHPNWQAAAADFFGILDRARKAPRGAVGVVNSE
jgi:glycosyltransferase involved in cell wall biosynthesis